MIERVFWRKQEIFNDYRNNKIKVLINSSLFTLIPAGIIYGNLYDKVLRKVPFSLQMVMIILTFQLNKNIILNYRNFNQRVRANYEKVSNKNKV
jgi:hypothetical protein